MSVSDVLVVGLAAFYIWYLLAEATIFDRPLGWVREKGHPLIGCSYCSAFWIVGVLLLIATKSYDPLTHIAAAGVAGLAGAHRG